MNKTKKQSVKGRTVCGKTEVARKQSGRCAFDLKFGQDVQRLAGELKPFLDDVGRETADRCVELYQRNEFVIMVAGEISVGKSSFLNALMGQSVLLTDTTETTAAITYLRSAEGRSDVKPDHVRINYKDGHSEWFSIHDVAKLRRATTSLNGNTKAIGTVKSAEVYCSKETLSIPQGFTIIDTPGLNGSDSHAALTHREMGLCHAALYLLDASKFGTLSNKEEFQKLYRYAPEVLFVVNKWDLVRHSAGANLAMMKHGTYFPQLGNWASDGVVTDENIFVISGSEAYDAKERYLEALKKRERLPENLRPPIDDRKFLPFQDNEFFALEGRLQQVLMSGEKSKMIRRRPLQTLLQMALDAQDAWATRESAFLTENADLDKKIKEEAARIRRERDEANACFDEIRNFASRLADFECGEYCRAITAGAQVISDGLSKFIHAQNAQALSTPSGQRAISAHLQKLVERNFRKPVTQRFTQFVAFLQKQLESEDEIKTFDGVTIAKADLVSDDLSDFQKEQHEWENRIAKLGPERESIRARKKELEGKLRNQCDELKTFDEQIAVYTDLQEEVARLRRSRTNLGDRPKKSGRYETKPYTRYVKKGAVRRFFGHLFSIFSDDDYDDYEETTEYRKVWVEDDSKGRAWDKKFAEIDKKVKEAECRARRAQPDEHRRNRINEEIRKIKDQIRRCESELSKLEERSREQEAEYRRHGETNFRKLVEANWQKEVCRIRDAYEETVRGFRTEVNRFLDAFMRSRSERIERAIVEMGNRERDLAEQRKRASGEFSEVRHARAALTKIVTELEKQLKAEA